jgi:NIMA (never in mitosis gene a)-related kinase
MGAAASAVDEFAVFQDMRAEYESKVQSGQQVDDRELARYFKRFASEQYSKAAEIPAAEEFDLDLVMHTIDFSEVRKDSVPILQDFTFSESTQIGAFYPFSDHPEPLFNSKGSSTKSSQSANPFATNTHQRKKSRSPDPTALRIRGSKGDCECSSWNQVPAYENVRFIGRGAFAVCHLARRKHDNKFVVLKKMLSPIQQLGKHEVSFLSEGNLLNQMNHPNIVRYFDSFVERGFMNLVMEFADGGNLHQQILQRRCMHRKSPSDSTLFPEKLVWDWGSQLLSALDHIHARSIIHRDIKPLNIFLSGPNQQIIKLGDFGIAKLVDGFTLSEPESSSSQVDHGVDLASDRDSSSSMSSGSNDSCVMPSFVGTPHYLAPELIEGEPATFASDMWAVGCVLYELCRLNRVYTGGTCIVLFAAILNGAKEQLPGVYSEQLSTLVEHMLAPEQGKRATMKDALSHPTVQTSLKDLENVLSFEPNSYAGCAPVEEMDIAHAPVEEMDIDQRMDCTERSIGDVVLGSEAPRNEQPDNSLLIQEEALAEVAHDQGMRLEMLQWLSEKKRHAQ